MDGDGRLTQIFARTNTPCLCFTQSVSSSFLYFHLFRYHLTFSSPTCRCTLSRSTSLVCIISQLPLTSHSICFSTESASILNTTPEIRFLKNTSVNYELAPNYQTTDGDWRRISSCRSYRADLQVPTLGTAFVCDLPLEIIIQSLFCINLGFSVLSQRKET